MRGWRRSEWAEKSQQAVEEITWKRSDIRKMTDLLQKLSYCPADLAGTSYYRAAINSMTGCPIQRADDSLPRSLGANSRSLAPLVPYSLSYGKTVAKWPPLESSLLANHCWRSEGF